MEKRRLFYYYVKVKNRPDYSSEIRKDRIWYRSKDLIYTIETFDEPNNTIYGLSHFHISNMTADFRLIQQIKAKKAVFNPELKKWQMQDGTLTIFDSLKGYPLTKKFKSRESDIAETPEDFEKERQSELLTLSELSYAIKKNAAAGLGVNQYKTKFHDRISLALTPLLMALIAIPFSFGNKRSQSLGKDLAPYGKRGAVSSIFRGLDI
jgi:lipopolysaccharide export system permease protein